MGICGNATPNCRPWEVLENKEIVPDPDVVGIGNVIAFLFSGFLTMSIALVHIFIDDGPLVQSNSLDNWILRMVRSKTHWHIGVARKAFLRPFLQKVVLELSDQQLLLGLAILIAGLGHHCSISVYNFRMVLNLAWISSAVHAFTLYVLRDYLRQSPKLRNWRLGLMVLTFILMVVYITLSAHRTWGRSDPYPAQCLFEDLVGNVSGSRALLMSINLLQMVWGYFKGISLLYRTVPVTMTGLLERPLKSIKTGSEKLRQRRKGSNEPVSTYYALACGPKTVALFIAEKALLSVRHLCFSIATFSDSRCTNVCFGLFLLVQGVVPLLARAIPKALTEDDRNQFSFGQIVPLLLLACPLMMFAEAYLGKNPLVNLSKNDTLIRRLEQRKKQGVQAFPQERRPLISKDPRKRSDAVIAGLPAGEIIMDDIEVEIEPTAASYRNHDLEAGDDGSTMGMEALDLQEGPNRRSIFPLG